MENARHRAIADSLDFHDRRSARAQESRGGRAFDQRAGHLFSDGFGPGFFLGHGLIRRVGVALAQESQASDVQILLGPGVNMKRSPLGGRNFEYFSEDPLLAGKMAAAYIQGVQSQGVGTSLKHYAANNQEFERMAASSNLDERTLHEVYLPAFEIAVREAHPWSVMAAYNPVNGIHAAENGILLRKILRTQWGFHGFVVSDWGAVHDRVKGVEAGLNLEMPGSGDYNRNKIIEAVRTGKALGTPCSTKS